MFSLFKLLKVINHQPGVVFLSRFCASTKRRYLLVTLQPDHLHAMFSVDNPIAEAVRQVHAERGERAGVAEFQRHFPRINASIALECVQRIAGLWPPFISVQGRNNHPGPLGGRGGMDGTFCSDVRL